MNDTTTKKPKTGVLVLAWRTATSRVRRAEIELENARHESKIANRALAAHIAPDDMQEGEQIGVWVRLDATQETLLVVIKDSTHGDFVLVERGCRE